MVTILHKIREETEVFEIELKPRLVVGETINTPQVKIMKSLIRDWKDVTEEFLLEDTVMTNNTRVQFMLRGGVDAEQAPGRYVVFTYTPTSQERIIHSTVFLNVFEK
jgi:hypothetical protein